MIQLIRKGRISERIVERSIDVPVVVQHQTSKVQDVRIQVFKGEHVVTKDNNLPCRSHFDEMPPAQRGASQIEVSFDIDTDESLNVSAQDRSTCRSNQISLTSEEEHLSPTETEDVTQEADEYRDGDKVDKTKIKAKSGLKNHCTAVRNTSIAEDLRSMFEVGHTKVTEKPVHGAIRSVQKTVEVPRVQCIDKVADIPVDVQGQGSTIQTCQHDIDEVGHVPAPTQSVAPTIPDSDDLCLDGTADEDRLEQESNKRKLPMPADAVSESRAHESDFDRFDALVLPSPEGSTIFMSIASGDEAEDGPEKEQEMTRSLVQGEESMLVDEQADLRHVRHLPTPRC